MRATIASLGVTARARNDARIVTGRHQRRALARAKRSDDRTHHVARSGVCGCGGKERNSEQRETEGWGGATGKEEGSRKRKWKEEDGNEGQTKDE